jgi:hypothetical protein
MSGTASNRSAVMAGVMKMGALFDGALPMQKWLRLSRRNLCERDPHS